MLSEAVTSLLSGITLMAIGGGIILIVKWLDRR